MKGLRGSSLGESGRIHLDATSEDQFEVRSIDGTSSTLSMERLSLDLMGDGDLSFTLNHGDDGASSSAGSSPLGWPLALRLINVHFLYPSDSCQVDRTLHFNLRAPNSYQH
jgi:hypothetical protein